MGSEKTVPPLLLEDVARAAAELTAERELEALLARFQDHLREWGSPSAVLAAIKDSSSESGWRLMPSLSFGSGPLGVELSLPRLIESAPGCLERPTIVRPEEEVPGVKPRDNCVVPWSHAGDSGILVLRGVPRPSPANLGEAVSVLSAPVWPRVLGGSLARIESLLADVRRAAETLGEDVPRQVERLRASRAPTEAAAGDDDDAEAARASKRETELEQARGEAQRFQREHDDVKERLLALETALEESEAERDQARAEAQKLSTGADSLRSDHATEVAQLVERCRSAEAAARTAEEVRTASQQELDEARAEMEHSTLDWDDLRGRVAVLQEALQDAEAERDRVGDEAERLSARVESMQADHATALENGEKARRTIGATAQTAQDDLIEAKKEIESVRKAAATAGGDQTERVASLETGLKDAVADRDRARTEVGQLSGRLESRQSEHDSTIEKLEEKWRNAASAAQVWQDELAGANRELDALKQHAGRSPSEASDQKERVNRLEAELKDVRIDRDRAREATERSSEKHGKTQADLKAARKDLARARKDLDSAQARVGNDDKGEGDEAGERPAPPASGDDGQALETLRNTLSVLRRTPFVAPGLRLSLEEGEALVAGSEGASARWLRVALLDRNASSIEPLADELEAAGLDVRVANYPEELALLMKTPDARDLGAVVCDILAFRPDQTVAGLFRGWEKDRPGLNFFLVFSSDDPAEAERASRVPQSLTAGRLSRPIDGKELIEKLQVMVQRQSASKS